MTPSRRRELELRVIANRKRNVNPEPFTRVHARGAWVDDTDTAALRDVHRTRPDEPTRPVPLTPRLRVIK